MSRNPKTLVLRCQVETTAFRSHEINSVTGNDGQYSPNSPDIRRSFGGSRSRYANLAALEVAQDRLLAGHDANIVRMETGWFSGVDGKMRFEIDDSMARFTQSVLWEGKLYPSRFLKDARDRGQSGGAGYLGDILDHPSLFDSYPDLKLMPVEARIRDSMESGSFDGKKIIAQAPTEEALVAVILHEVQHAIQTFEGFARGGSPDQFGAAYAEVLRERLIHQSKMLKRAEANGGTDPVTGQYIDDLKALARHTAKELIPYNSTMRPIEQYHRLAGEEEARNVMARLHLSSEDRQRVEPQVTADVQPQDILIIFDGDLVSLSRERVR